MGKFILIWVKPHLTFYRSFIFSFGTKKEKKKKDINVSFKHLLANLRYMHNLT